MNPADRGDQIAVSRYQKSDVKAVLDRIHHEFNGDVDIGHLLVMGSVGMATPAAHDLIRKKMSIIDLEIRQRLESFQKDLLTEPLIIWLLDNGREIFGLNECLSWPEKLLGELVEIEPVEPFPTLGPETVIQIVAVYVCDDFFHG